MLISAVITLRPTTFVILPADQGRTVHAWFLNQVQRYDAALSHAIHDQQGPKAFTCSSLNGPRSRARDSELALTPDATAWLRVTSLIEPLSTLLLNFVLPGLPETITIGDATLTVQEVFTDAGQHPWAGQSSYAKLLQRHTLSTEQPIRRISLRFASPTTFRRGKFHLPVPLPDLIVQGWLARWNAFSGVSLPDEVYRYALEYLAISRYNLRTEAVHHGPATLIGCVGACSYYALNADPYWLRLTHTLAAYCFFCGTGHKTTQGLGQTRPIGHGR